MKKLSLYSIFTIKPFLSLISIILTFFFTYFSIELRVYIGNLINENLLFNNFSNIFLYLIKVFLIIIIIRFFNTYVSKQISINISKYIYTYLFENLEFSKVSWLEKQNNGIATTLFTSDVNNIENYSNRIFNVFIQDVFLFILAFIYMSKVNRLLPIIAIISAIIPIIFLTINTRALKSKYNLFQNTFSISNEILSNCLKSLELVKVYLIKDRVFEMYKNKLKESNRISRKISILDACLSAPTMLSSFFMILLTVGYGGWLIGDNKITLGNLLAIIMISDFIIDPIMKISGTISVIRKASINIDRLNKFFLSPKEEEMRNASKLDNNILVEFKNVSLSFDNKIKPLDNFNFKILKGKYYCIVGAIGSGKSTMIKLLTGAYKPDSGEILVNDKLNIKEFFSVVTQDVVLFSGSVLENIAFVKPKAGFNEIKNVCKLAGIHNEIMNLPQGYNTIIGEHGYDLSGGQKQRISIARAFLKESDLIILDEPSSALDKESSNLVKEAIYYLNKCKNKTIIVITHDINFIDDSAIIYNMGAQKYV